MFLGYSEDEYCSARFQTTAGPGGNHGVGGTPRRSARGKQPTITPRAYRDLRIYSGAVLAHGAGFGAGRQPARGQEAAAKLAAIPDTEALRTADEALTHSDLDDDGEAVSFVVEKIERMVAIYREGVQPNFASVSVAELWAYCIAMAEVGSG